MNLAWQIHGLLTGKVGSGWLIVTKLVNIENQRIDSIDYGHILNDALTTLILNN